METIFLKDLIGLQNTVVTIGVYDGLHFGHLALLKAVFAAGRSIQGKSVLLTFGDHPRQIIQVGVGDASGTDKTDFDFIHLFSRYPLFLNFFFIEQK